MMFNKLYKADWQKIKSSKIPSRYFDLLIISVIIDLDEYYKYYSWNFINIKFRDNVITTSICISIIDFILKEQKRELTGEAR